MCARHAASRLHEAQHHLHSWRCSSLWDGDAWAFRLRAFQQLDFGEIKKGNPLALDWFVPGNPAGLGSISTSSSERVLIIVFSSLDPYEHSLSKPLHRLNGILLQLK